MTEKKAEDRMILGEGVAYSTDSSITGLNNNIVIAGGSGSGKTMSFLEPRLITAVEAPEEYARSFIIPVAKKRIIDMYAPQLRARGYNVGVLDCVDMDNSDYSYDQLQYVTSYSDINFLAESIVLADPRKARCNSDPYWDQSAISLLCAEIAYMLVVKPGATFLDVLRMNDHLKIDESSGSLIKTTLDDNFAHLEKLAPGCYAMNCWKTFAQLPPKTAGCVFGTMNSCIDSLYTPEIRRMIEAKPAVDVESIAKRKSVLFIRTSPVNQSLNALVSAFYGQAIKVLFEFAEQQPDGKLPIPVEFIFDDFATGARVVNFEESISIFREKGISAAILIQSEAQLERMYSEAKAREILDNCDTYEFMGGMDYTTARNVSLRANIPLEDVFSLPVGDIIIFRRGQKPIRTKRYNIRGSATYQRILKEYEDSIAQRKRRSGAPSTRKAER